MLSSEAPGSGGNTRILGGIFNFHNLFCYVTVILTFAREGLESRYPIHKSQYLSAKEADEPKLPVT